MFGMTDSQAKFLVVMFIAGCVTSVVVAFGALIFGGYVVYTGLRALAGY